jgi:hypothetical protein
MKNVQFIHAKHAISSAEFCLRQFRYMCIDHTFQSTLRIYLDVKTRGKTQAVQQRARRLTCNMYSFTKPCASFIVGSFAKRNENQNRASLSRSTTSRDLQQFESHPLFPNLTRMWRTLDPQDTNGAVNSSGVFLICVSQRV